MKNKLTFLHVIHDDKKFFPSSLTSFDKDNRLVNKCVLIVKREQDAFRSITSKDRVKVLIGRKNVKNYLKNEEYDVVYFHSMSCFLWPYLKYIPKGKKVIWWAWGFDVYSGYFFKPILPIMKYKSETAKVIYKKGFVSIPKNIILGVYYAYLKKSVVKRINYFNPVIGYEYTLFLKFNKSANAKIFYRHPVESVNEDKLIPKPQNGYILVGNSSSATNNHLDVLTILRKINLKDRKIIIPLNYGNKSYGDYIEHNSSIPGNQVVPIREFMPREEYFQLVNGCSYAVYGVLRQQAMGNIYHGLYNGIKIFLYKDSIVYQDLKYNGFFVFAIEEMTDSQLSTPLTIEEAEWNRSLYKALQKKCETIYNTVIDELLKEKNNRSYSIID